MENILFIVFLLTLNLIWCSPLHKKDELDESPVVIFAFSGLRHDVCEMQAMPSLEQLKKEGVWAKRKIDAFQSETLPAFVTLVTGQYPDKHGMLSNKMKDLKTGENFDVTTTSSKWWDSFEPIWITNQNQNNGSGSSALCYWPGHDISFKGSNLKHHCNHKKYQDPFKEFTTKNIISKNVMPFEERLNQVKEWLKMNTTDRPSFIGVYFEEPLQTMMKYGVSSNKTKQMLKRIDAIIGDMVKSFKNEEIYEKVTFVVTGESGVTELNLSEHKEIFLEDKLEDSQKTSFDIIDDGPIMTVYPHDNKTKQLFLSKWKNEEGLKVYSKEDLPNNFHFSHEQRTMPIIIIAEEHWRVYPKRIVDDKQCLMGYDSKFSSSHALLIAKGPLFKKNLVLDAMGNVDVYGLLCKALNITALPHSGNEAIIKKVIVPKQKWIEKIVTKIYKTITESPKNIIITVIVAVMLFFVASFLVISAVYKAVGCCVCPSTPMKVNVLSPRKLLRKRKDRNGGGKHLLADEEISDSDISSSDDFYFDAKHKIKNGSK